MDSDGPKRATSLKAHKALPRNPSKKRNSSDSHVVKEVERIERRMSQAQEKSDDISSWIGDSMQVVTDPNLPLTPPSLPKDPEELQIDEENTPIVHEPGEPKPTPDAQRIHTPVLQRSPPTPDQTPPRAGQYPRSGLKSHLTPPPTLRQPSSVAESFKTAQEQLFSDDDETTVLSSRKERVEAKNPAGIGLGLGLEMSEGSGTPTVRTPSVGPKIQALDEPWDESAGVVEDPFVASESVAVQQMQGPKKHRRRRKRSKAAMGTSSTSTPEDFQASLERNTPLRNRLEQERENSPSSVEKFAAQIQWPSESEELSTIHVDQKRLSEMSNQSQVVQALVVSTPPQRRQKLRHSSKNESLRTAGSPLNSSNRSSLVSNETKPRLHHQRAKLTDKGNRVSVNSDSGISMGSDLRKKVDEALPASEIPKRRSSLRSSKRRLPNLQRLVEVESGPGRTRRPGTAPDGATKSPFGTPSRRPRATSDVNQSAPVNEARGRKLKSFAPTVPPRSSSLSAPTSRNASRTTSLTSTSLHKHNMQQQIVQQVAPLQPPAQASPERHPSNFLMVDNEDKRTSDDMSGGRYRSLLATPFSMTSMQSSTPGPYEVNEATAINIYPHNNTSVLVVQQLPRRGSEQPRLSASLSGNVQINLDSFRMPPRVPSSRRVMDSPLKNPREPPRPPPVVLIPPTPAQPESAPPSRGRRSETSSTSGTGPFSKVRRALSARRYSESFINPFTATLVSRNNSGKTNTNRKRIKSDGKSSQVSAFWRPRGFWNDLSDDEDDEPRTPRPGFIRTSIRGPPDASGGSGGFVRRLGSLKSRSRSRPRRNVPTAANESDGTYVSYGTSEYHMYDGSPDNYDDVERKVGILSRIRGTTHLRPFTSLQEAMREMKQKRIEDQLEKQRERLRKNIGPVILQQDARPFY